MTVIARICDQWTMEIEEPKSSHNEWFLNWVLRSPSGASKHLTSSYLALQSLRDLYGPGAFMTCREYFGGMGAHALMIEELFYPALRDHYVNEFAPEAVRHLHNLRPGRLVARQQDAYAIGAVAPADLQVLDFGDLTVWKTRDGEAHRELMDLVFATEPKAVLLTDIAARYLHLHQGRYESLLGPGTCGTYESYLRALLARLSAIYGYELAGGCYDRWSSVMALVPEERAGVKGKLIPTPDSPAGLRLL